MTNINNQANPDLAGMVPSMINPADMVPPEEQAVEGEPVCEERDIVLSMCNPYQQMLSADDLAVEPVMPDELLKATKKGLLSPAIGMARMTNTLGGRFFARICVDEQQRRRIEFCQQYENGLFSPKIVMKQSSFLQAVQNNFGTAKISQRKLKNTVEKFVFDLCCECLDKFDGAMTFDVVEVLKALAKCYGQLPICVDSNGELSPGELYMSIISVLQETNSEDDDDLLQGHKSYYPLRDDDVKYIAERLDMPKISLLKKLKEYSFLYLTPSSRGYQTNIRLHSNDEDVETRTEWRYCLFRFKYLIEPQTSDVKE